MRKQHSIAEARKNLPRLVREAETGKPIELTRRGESVAVLLGRKDYERLASRARRFSEAWNEFAHTVDLTELGIDPDQIFDVRDRQPGMTGLLPIGMPLSALGSRVVGKRRRSRMVRLRR